MEGKMAFLLKSRHLVLPTLSSIVSMM